MATNGSKTPPSLTLLAARRLHQIANDDLSPEVYDKAVHCIIDYLGAVHTGLLLPWKDALLKYASLNLGSPQAYAWGIDKEVSTETAAFVNAVLAHRWVMHSEQLAVGRPRSCGEI